ncbi:MAG: branched-chain amino acid ABC transporter permease [Armatimonadetes bacterium]|nr:branched-chain amino acid ABC transporter permease [Armatimonadota bacterium]MBS1712424.1 branched-chain amino acid ABC transporter permease [Armatimonadota bacterium]MBX3109267.1 branched-chain amino acid ABC transporter permease [Fimbriimonadaceae bacterium]
MDSVLHLVAGFTLDFSSLPQQLVNGLVIGAIYALIALGYTMVYGVLRLINFAHGEVFMLGAYTALLTSYTMGFTPELVKKGVMQGHPLTSSPFNLVILILASMAVCAVIGAVIEFLAYRPMRNQSRIAALITAIGVSLFLQYGGQLFLPANPPPSVVQEVNPFQGVINHSFRKAVIAQDGSVTSPAIELTVTQGKVIMLVTVVVLMGLLTYLVMYTRAGRAMRAASHDFDSASLMGVNVNRVVTFTFMLGSALAGAGAMMLATFEGTPLQPFYGLLPGVKAFVAAVLGGIGNIPGAVLGGIVMGLAETLVVWLGFSQYKDAVAFVILIFVLLLKPGGLLGSDKVEKV